MCFVVQGSDDRINPKFVTDGAGGVVAVRFYIDPESGLPHLYSHGVRESEAEQVLRSPGEDRPGRDGSRVAIGQTRAGRYLRVIYVPDPGSTGVFVITAYELTGNALRAYRRRRRRSRP